VSAQDVALGADVDATFGATRVPVSRYTSPEFAAREVERLWPHVWQIACTVDHVAEPGDYFEYRAGPYSVLVVRGDDGELRAFQNVCRHRGNTLCQGAGGGLAELRCPWHGWTWDLRGRLREVPSRRWFGTLRNDDFPLFEAGVGVWGPLVFVNLDAAAAPLSEYLEGVPADCAWADLDEFRCLATTTTDVACNWKVVADGFGETYHVQGLHREMLGSIDDIDTPQRLWTRHGVSYQRYGLASPRLGDVDDQRVWDSFVQTQGGRMGAERVGQPDDSRRCLRLGPAWEARDHQRHRAPRRAAYGRAAGARGVRGDLPARRRRGLCVGRRPDAGATT
jgi:phenylpropionate dioxygenase-like ring-hydroxylating dioxygenase large terminal subunit